MKCGAGSGNCTQVEWICSPSRKLLRQTGSSTQDMAGVDLRMSAKLAYNSVYDQVIDYLQFIEVLRFVEKS